MAQLPVMPVLLSLVQDEQLVRNTLQVAGFVQFGGEMLELAVSVTRAHWWTLVFCLTLQQPP